MGTQDSTRSGRNAAPRLRRLVLRALVLSPLVLGVALFAGLLTAQALYPDELEALGGEVRAVLVDRGLLPAPPEPAATERASLPLNLMPRSTLAAFITPGLSALEAAQTQTAYHSPTPSVTATPTETATATGTHTPSPTATETASPTATHTPTGTLTPSSTATRTPYPTWTPLPTRTPTRTPRPSQTFTPRPSPTATATWDPAIPTYTPTQTSTPVPVPSDTPITTSCDYSLNTGFENQVAQLINDERQARGLYAYRVQSQLRAAARVQAADMACNHFTGHTGSDGSTVRDRVEDQGYAWSWIGENYMVSQDPVRAFNWWMNSTPHTANILSPNYTEFGVGYVYSSESDYGGYFVVVFARPR